MNEAVATLEGWYVSHDIRTLDWQAWKSTTAVERAKALDELAAVHTAFSNYEVQKSGGYGLYVMAGNKADFMWIQLRPTLEELIAAKHELNRTRFADFTRPAYSYVSVVELSGYLAKPGVDVSQDPYVQGRLKPALPKTQNVCFYPMNKRREGNDNWYMLSMDERREMMRSHGMIGRSYAGRVTQIITGSVGLDDWEWGVTLYADDPVVFKKLVYEMRFDEASARFGEFGPFYVGSRTDVSALGEWLHV
ncbi:heme-dependent peroxidase [Alicyclobacillus cycloheptanicus]|uniref:Coproheme decarboxylase n=1 Tax=Alicyclobacillus cycloheptanicus TaxID=1457 RepID=A0ABT9XLY3_9BACL|nr:hydrogen peroxide-dependent heme synthase [Alicyclobacillus cycloheptanicus]MDQ0191321.1 chlorite dismutase [Alicyclobacillus cycloheptanicus]WDM00816.1 heme-dependent peroxidase [Alicyclobacillus cycloheptanicus]